MKFKIIFVEMFLLNPHHHICVANSLVTLLYKSKKTLHEKIFHIVLPLNCHGQYGADKVS